MSAPRPTIPVLAELPLVIETPRLRLRPFTEDDVDAIWPTVSDAAVAVVKFGFATLGLHKITVACVVENVASRRVIEKVGFRHVGRLDDHMWRDGRWWSQLRYELTAPEGPDARSSR